MQQAGRRTLQELTTALAQLKTQHQQISHRLEDELDKKLDLQRQVAEYQRMAARDKK
jgi:hypothetical protein